MKILLLGEYSNVHYTLSQGLRALGHEVTIASDGDGWKNYPRDIDLKRSSMSFFYSLYYYFHLWNKFRKFCGYDIVQIINPIFVDLKAERVKRFYSFLRKHNRHLVLGAFGMDYYYVKACLDQKIFRYSDFYIGSDERNFTENRSFIKDWYEGQKGELNRYVADDCDAIVAGLYEYYASYRTYCSSKDKLRYIPFPIVMPRISPINQFIPGDKVRIFIGIQRSRSEYKGTDIMLRAAKRVAAELPDKCELLKVENLPFKEYVPLMNTAHVILDQLYSYTPAMNSLEAMARGLINVGGAEAECYEILKEKELNPIINVSPNEESVYQDLKHLVDNKDKLVPKMQQDSCKFIKKHHEYISVAKQYEALYNELLVADC